MMYVIGPGHGGPGLVASAYLDGTYSEVYPDIGLDEDGLGRLFKQFSFPGGIPSHVAPETPGLDPRGRRARLLAVPRLRRGVRQPRPVVAAVVGDGEAETGPLATSWHSNKFIDPRRDGAVLPILHLNGYKIANPTVLARIPEEELVSLMRGYGHTPYVVDGRGPRRRCTRRSPPPSTTASTRSATSSRRRARRGTTPATRRPWPMIVLRSPKGWTGPKEVDGKQVEGYWRSHQVPFADARANDAHRAGARGLAAQLPPRGAVRRDRRRRRRDPRPAPGR